MDLGFAKTGDGRTLQAVLDDVLRDIDFDDLAAVSADHVLGMTLVRMVQAARAIAVGKADVMHEIKFLESVQNAVHAHHVNLSVCIFDAGMNGVGGQRFACIGKGLKHRASSLSDAQTVRTEDLKAALNVLRRAVFFRFRAGRAHKKRIPDSKNP